MSYSDSLTEKERFILKEFIADHATMLRGRLIERLGRAGDSPRIADEQTMLDSRLGRGNAADQFQAGENRREPSDN